MVSEAADQNLVAQDTLGDCSAMGVRNGQRRCARSNPGIQSQPAHLYAKAGISFGFCDDGGSADVTHQPQPEGLPATRQGDEAKALVAAWES